MKKSASELWPRDSAKVRGLLTMEEKSTVNGAGELESGARIRKFQRIKVNSTRNTKVKRS